MLSTEWLAAFAPVGAVQAPDRWAAFGACVFFSKPPFVWTITAGHIVDKIGAQAVSVLVTQVGGGVSVIEIGKVLLESGESWVRDLPNDLAAAPTPLASQLGIKAIPAELCLPFREVTPSMPSFTVGCPYGLHGVDSQRAIPLVLDGVIAGTDSASNRVYTSAPTFPGNSGGPLIAVRTPFNPSGGIVVGSPTILLAGIMLETRLFPDPESRIPPLHLGLAAPTDAIISLLDSQAAQVLVARFGPKQI